MRIDKCFNCGNTPVIKPSGESQYPFVLNHVQPSHCPHQLEAWHTSPELCVEVWNNYNREKHGLPSKVVSKPKLTRRNK